MSIKLTTKVFNQIRKSLLENGDTQADIAKRFHVGSSTVSLVNVYGSWANYQAKTKAPKTLRQRRKRALELAKLKAQRERTLQAQESRRARAQRAGLNPVDPVERQLENGLAKLASSDTGHSIEEFRKNTVTFDTDPTAHLPVLPRDNDEDEKPQISEGLRWLIAYGIMGLSLVISIIAVIK